MYCLSYSTKWCLPAAKWAKSYLFHASINSITCSVDFFPPNKFQYFSFIIFIKMTYYVHEPKWPSKSLYSDHFFLLNCFSQLFFMENYQSGQQTEWCWQIFVYFCTGAVGVGQCLCTVCHTPCSWNIFLGLRGIGCTLWLVLVLYTFLSLMFDFWWQSVGNLC